MSVASRSARFPTCNAQRLSIISSSALAQSFAATAARSLAKPVSFARPNGLSVRRQPVEALEKRLRVDDRLLEVVLEQVFNLVWPQANVVKVSAPTDGDLADAVSVWLRAHTLVDDELRA
jgi:hypothetical protein